MCNRSGAPHRGSNLCNPVQIETHYRIEFQRKTGRASHRHGTENPRVGGSIPPLATIQLNDFKRFSIGLCRGNPVVVPYLCRNFL
jgi:hypothetical protein